MLRPANYPEGTPGRGVLHTEKAGVSWAVINLQGREQMVPIDCPFRALDALVQRVNAVSGDANYGDASYGDAVSGKKPIILVDFHAESAREKEALGYFIDGRASLVAGTHTHVQTADERVLPRGSAYITDLGMTGVCGGVIGMDAQICLDRARTQILYRMEPARPDGESGGQSAVMGVAAEIDGDTGRALSVTRVFRRAPSA